MTNKQDSGMFEKEHEDILQQRKDIEECMRDVKRDLKILKEIVSDGLQEDLVETAAETVEEEVAPVDQVDQQEDIQPEEARPEPLLTPEQLGLVTSDPVDAEEEELPPEDSDAPTEVSQEDNDVSNKE